MGGEEKEVAFGALLPVAILFVDINQHINKRCAPIGVNWKSFLHTYTHT